MNKTLLKKLTEKHAAPHTTPITRSHRGDSSFAGLINESGLLEEAAKDLLRPRPEAVARLLELAKGL